MKKDELISKGADAISLFCRLNINIKRDIPIRSSEMGLLILSVKSEEPLTPVMAASFFHVKKPMISAMVNKLISLGYIEKTPSLVDKRSFIITPTEKALTLVDETYNEYNMTMELLYEKLKKDEFNNLIKLLEKANLILEEGK